MDVSGMLIQTAALPWRLGHGSRTEVLLVTGRASGRWIIPKGWPMRGKTLAKAAAQEAFEEAGVLGTVDTKPLGSFRHTKQRSVLRPVEIRVLVHALSVDRELSEWPEFGQRQRRWFSLEEAAITVYSKELRGIILRLS
jgi:8-oxo-dGTP pyrophosphatase MutT (NUDIX family)